MAMILLLLVLLCPTAWASPGRERIHKITSWGIQLQGARGQEVDLLALTKAPHDLLVLDPGSSGEKPLGKEQVEALKNQGKRLVLAYLSIGEAEEYRPYFKKEWKHQPPAFLTEENPQWRGNYKVRYWDPAWQSLVLSQVEEIGNAGFDGVYLDIIDAYEYFGLEGPKPERGSAALDMVTFVVRIAERARKVNPAFLVVPQNGAEILDHVGPSEGENYLRSIDGIAAEDTFFFGKKKVDNPKRIQHPALQGLLRFRGGGKVVFSLEYLRDKRKRREFVELASKYGFLPYVAPRELDRLNAPILVPARSAP